MLDQAYKTGAMEAFRALGLTMRQLHEMGQLPGFNAESAPVVDPVDPAVAVDPGPEAIPPVAKEAGMIGDTGRAVGQMFFGDPLRVMREGKKTFSQGGLLHHSNVFWPEMQKGLKGWDRIKKNALPVAMRAGTVMSALPVYHALRGHGDPNEGRLTNALGSLGETAGNMYGFMAGGMIGGPVLGRAGKAVGQSVGRLFGSRPAPPPPQPQYAPQYQLPAPQYPQQDPYQ